VYWALGRNVGDTIDYVDEHGRGFKLKIVGMTANTILQGSLLIDEHAFTQHFPNASGYQMFLIDSTEDAGASQISQTLSHGLRDWGLEVTSASRRLALYNEVENTYLSIFQALGGLGLILGSVGLGIVVLRNVLERRSELAVLRAVGFRRSAVHKQVVTEHWLLLGLGVACGVVSAAVAVLPALQTSGRTMPYGQLLLTLAAVTASGALWTYLAAKAALHGNILRALRKE
jgi:ABC-type antimicrobial peptide transport system permease subunit